MRLLLPYFNLMPCFLCLLFYFYILLHGKNDNLHSITGLVHSYLQCSKVKEALYAAREAMKAMPQSAKALKLVGDVHASNASGREKVNP